MSTVSHGLDATQRDALKSKLLSARADLVARRAEQLRARLELVSEVEDEGDSSLRANTEDELVTRVESEHAQLTEIDRALEKLQAGTYGLDEETGEPIEYERLLALPWTRYSVETQEALERR